MSKKRYDTNLASEFFVLSTLYRCGMDASLTLGNKKAVDIAVVLEEGKAVTVDVKAVAGKMDWLLGNTVPHQAPNHFLVLVSYEGNFSSALVMPRTWVLPSRAATQFVKVASNKKTRYIPRKAFLERGSAYENAWNLLRAQI